MWLNRLETMVGKEKIDKLKNSRVAIIGLGGVGGNALESLVRFNIGNIIIVDSDVIERSNLNRQLLSLRSNIGEKKIDVAKKRILDINPECNIISLDLFIDKSNVEDLFKYDFDYLIDACDTIDTKMLLIKECNKRNIQIISCMGTANKFNPSLLEITDIRKTTYDPIAKIIRKKIKENNIKYKIDVVSSSEKTINSKELGSNSIVPSSAGILCAYYIIKKIINL